MDNDMNDVMNEKRNKSQEASYDLSTAVAPVTCRVIKVKIEDGKHVKKGKTLLVWREEVIASKSSRLPTLCEGQPFLSDQEIPSLRFSEFQWISKYKPRMENWVKGLDSRFVKYSVVDVSTNRKDTKNSLMARVSDNDVGERYEKFKRFDTLVDHSDHLFSYTWPPPRNPFREMWIREQWRILARDLPETIFVRVYKSRMDLLRVAFVGPEGTPYHDGLFFFDLFFPEMYPIEPPLVRYHSGGLAINPSVLKCGHVICQARLRGTSDMLQLLLSLQRLILNSKPIFSGDIFKFNRNRNSSHKEMFSWLYNENILIKSLKTMVYIMNNPPKNFEDLVVGHFRKSVSSILSACKAYTEGLQGQRLGNQICSIQFKNDVATQIKPLVAGFKKIGATVAEGFLDESEKKLASLIAAEFASTLVLKKTKGNRKNPKRLEYKLKAPTFFVVNKVFVHKGMKVKEGQPLFSSEDMRKKDTGHGHLDAS